MALDPLPTPPWPAKETVPYTTTQGNLAILYDLWLKGHMIQGPSGDKWQINSEGQGHVVLKGSVDDDNSTATPLNAGIVFPGEWVNTLEFAVITVIVKSDVVSATDGLSVKFSSDGVNIDGTDDFTIPAGKGKTFSFQPQAKYFKVDYTNGGTNQSYFRLQTILKKSYVKPSSHRVQDAIIDQDDAELVKAVLSGEDPDNIFQNVKTTKDGNLTISDNSSGLAIARGDVSGSSFISKFGQNENIGTGAYEDIWDVGGLYTWPADGTAPITHIDSDNAADTEPIEVQGLDINGAQVTQTKTLTGTTPVALDTPLWRVFRLKNTGTSNTAGNVQAINAGDTVIYAQIQGDNNQTLMALYTIPAGITGYLVMGGASLVGLTRSYSLDGRFYMRPFGGIFQLKHTFGVSSDGTSTFQHEYKIPLPIAEKTDLRVSAISSALGGVLNVTFDIVLEDN